MIPALLIFSFQHHSANSLAEMEPFLGLVLLNAVSQVQLSIATVYSQQSPKSNCVLNGGREVQKLPLLYKQLWCWLGRDTQGAQEDIQNRFLY